MIPVTLHPKKKLSQEEISSLQYVADHMEDFEDALLALRMQSHGKIEDSDCMSADDFLRKVWK